jgi:hypothetical protein
LKNGRTVSSVRISILWMRASQRALRRLVVPVAMTSFELIGDVKAISEAEGLRRLFVFDGQLRFAVPQLLGLVPQGRASVALSLKEPPSPSHFQRPST